MSDVDARRVFTGWADAVGRHDWDALATHLDPNAVIEYPQSGERFVGVANIRGQFENYPGLEPGTTRLEEVIGDTAYALTPTYTVIAVEGTGTRGTAVLRVRYPDGSRWWAINLYELRDGRIGRSRVYFAPEFDPPEWRAPFREGS
jgi:ketosteroid isomerase-like protein